MYALSDSTKNWERSKDIEDFKNEMTSVFQDLKDNPILKGERGIVDVKEFVAELANPVFRAKIQEIDKQNKEKKTFWSRILDAFKSLLGLHVTNSYYQRSMNALDKALNSFDIDSYMRYNGIKNLLRLGYNEKDWDFRTLPDNKLKDAIKDYFDKETYNEELLSIKKKAIADGTFMKAPNGKPTNLNERQWLQVRTKAFKDWFGDWENDPENASKVVDENGEPLVVYHGTTTPNIHIFDLEKTVSGKAFWFANEVAQKLVYYGSKSNSNLILMPLYVNMKKPLLNDGNSMEDYATDESHDGGLILSTLKDFKDNLDEEEYQAALDNGIKDNDIIATGNVTNPNQLKSATDNVGTFSTDNDEIYNYEVDNSAITELKPQYRGKLIYAQSGTGKSTIADNKTVFDSDYILGNILGVSTETAGFFFKTLSAKQKKAFGEQYRETIKQMVADGYTVLTANESLLNDADVVIYNQSAQQTDERVNGNNRALTNKYHALEYHQNTLAKIKKLKDEDKENTRKYVELDGKHYLSDVISSGNNLYDRTSNLHTDSEQKKSNAILEEQQRDHIISSFLNEFGISVNMLDNYDGELPLFDALNKVINARTKADITEGVGYAIAFMMQSDPEMQRMIVSSHGMTGDYNKKIPIINKKIKSLHPNQHSPVAKEVLREIGRQITSELKNNFGTPIEEVKSKKTIWKVIKNFFTKIGMRIAALGKRNKVLKQENLFVKDIIEALSREDFSRIKGPNIKEDTTELAQRVYVEQALKDNPFEDNIIRKLGEHGIALAGSTSIALQGSLFRPSENPLHDIDFNAGDNSSKESLDKLLPTIFPNGTIQFSHPLPKDRKGNQTVTYILLSEPFTIKKTGYNTAEFYSKDGRYLGKRVHYDLFLEDGVQGKMLDFFTGPTKKSDYGFYKRTINGHTYLISESNAAMAAKIKWARPKDMWDYKRFIKDTFKATDFIQSLPAKDLKNELRLIEQEEADYDLVNGVEKKKKSFDFDFEKPKTQMEKDLEAIKANDWNLPEEVRKKVEEKLEKYLVSKSGEVQQDIDVSPYFGKDNQTTAKNVLEYIIENSTDREIKNMAQYVLNNLGKNTNVPVKFLQNGNSRGKYYASTHSIIINAKSLTGSNAKEVLNRMEGTIIHEIAHAITVRAMESDPAARKEILEIFSEFKKLGSQYGITLGYASKNPKEFVAEFLGNKAFREALMELPSSTKKVTLGQKFLNFIKKILGIPVKNTFFNRTDDAILRLMDYANAREWDNIQSEDEDMSTPQTFTFADGTVVKAPFKPNAQQIDALNEMDRFIESDETSMTLSGYAGTGKTSIMQMLAEKAKKQHRRVEFCASTNKAAAVLNDKVSKSGFQASTLNKLFGIAVEVNPNSKSYNAKNLVNALKDNNLFVGTTVIIDEASMINEENYNIINEIAKNNYLKIIYVGDEAQLAPVNEENISKVFRNGDGKIIRLTQVERTDDNAILKEATDLRNDKPLSGVSSFNAKGEGVAYIAPQHQEAVDEVVEHFVEGLKKDPNYFRILAYTNKVVSKYNDQVRELLGYTTPIPQVGEPMAGYTNWGYTYDYRTKKGTYRFINSESYKVVSVGKPTKVSHSLNGIPVIMEAVPVTLEDSMGKRDTFNYMDIKSNPQNRHNAEILANEKNRLWKETKKRGIGRDVRIALYGKINDIEKFLFVNDAITDNEGNVLQSKVIDFGYAMTVHKSQGSTFTNVLVDDVDISRAGLSNKSNYTEAVNLEEDTTNIPSEDNLNSMSEVIDLGDLSEVSIEESSKTEAQEQASKLIQQLEYVAVSRATDTVTIISNDVKKEDSPLHYIKDTKNAENFQGATTILPKFRGAMSFSYGNAKRADVESSTTFDAIKAGERTATTRYTKDGNISYWKQVKVGDIIEFHNNKGEKIYVEVVKPLTLLPQNTSAEAWSQKEGWSTAYFDKNVKPEIEKGEAYQMEYKYLGDNLNTINSKESTIDAATQTVQSTPFKYTYQSKFNGRKTISFDSLEQAVQYFRMEGLFNHFVGNIPSAVSYYGKNEAKKEYARLKSLIGTLKYKILNAKTSEELAKYSNIIPTSSDSTIQGYIDDFFMKTNNTNFEGNLRKSNIWKLVEPNIRQTLIREMQEQNKGSQQTINTKNSRSDKAWEAAATQQQNNIENYVQIHKGNWSREEAKRNPKVLYIFTDNTDRDSGSGIIPNDSWYSKKYGQGHHFPTMTAAVVRGLDNARPISTQRWYHQGAKGTTGRWTDADINEFKKIIKEELQEIINEFNTNKYDTIMFPDGDSLFNTRISNITKERTPKLYQVLGELLHEFGFDSLVPTDILNSQSQNNTQKAINTILNFKPEEAEFYSGAANGSDKTWEEAATKAGIKVTNYTVENWNNLSNEWKERLDKEYQEIVTILGRRVLDINTYAGKLVRRDMMQADKADAIFAIGTLASNGYVDGGTGYASTRGILRGIPVYLFDQKDSTWKVWDKTAKKFVPTSQPALTKNAAVIGTRELQENGKKAIENMFQTSNSNIEYKKDGEVSIKYTPTGKETQTYTIKGNQIFNKDGKEVFKEDSVDRNKIFANLAVQQGRAVVVEHNNRKYVVNNRSQIISGTTGKLLQWRNDNGDRRAIIKAAGEKFKERGVKAAMEKSVQEAHKDVLNTLGNDKQAQAEIQSTLKTAVMGIALEKALDAVTPIFTKEEQEQIKKALGEDKKLQVMSVSRMTDPVFFTKEIINFLAENAKKPFTDASRVNAIEIWSKHDGIPMQELLKACKKYKVAPMVSFSITGLGDTTLERGVMKYNDLLDRIEKYIKAGDLNPSTTTIRIDPILIGETNLDDIKAIVNRAKSMGIKKFVSSLVQSYGYLDGTPRDRKVVSGINAAMEREHRTYDWDKYYGRITQEDFAASEAFVNKYRATHPRASWLEMVSAGAAEGVRVVSRSSIGKIHFIPKQEYIEEIGKVLLEINKDPEIELETCSFAIKGLRASACLDPLILERITGVDVTDPNDRYKRDTSRPDCMCYGAHSDIFRMNEKKCFSSCAYCYAGKSDSSAISYYNEDGSLKDTIYTRTEDLSQLSKDVNGLYSEDGKSPLTIYRGYALMENREAKSLNETVGKTAIDYDETLKGALYFTSSEEEAADYAKSRTDKSPEPPTAEHPEGNRINRHYTGDYAKVSKFHILSTAKVEHYKDIIEYIKNGRNTTADVIVLNKGTMWADNTEYIVKNPDVIVFDKEKAEDNFSDVFQTPNTSRVETEDVMKPWKKDASKVNKTRRIYLKGQKDKGYFEIVKDLEDNNYSIHFKPTDSKNPNAFTEEEKNILFQAAADVIPEGANLSTWGELSKGGIHGLNRFLDLGFVKTGDRNAKMKTGEDVNIPILTKSSEISMDNLSSKTVSLPGYEELNGLYGDTPVDAEWKIPYLKELDAQISGEKSEEENNNIINKMNTILQATSEKEYQQETQDSKKAETQNVLNEYDKLLKQFDNLLDNEDGLTASEIRHIAELVGNDLSDMITDLQKEKGLAKEQFPSLETDLDFQSSSRRKIVETVDINRLIDRCKKLFSTEVVDYDDVDQMLQADVIIDNFDAIMHLAADVFALNEGFGIVKDYKTGKYTLTKQSPRIDYDNFHDYSNDEDIAAENGEKDGQEHWQVESRTIDVLTSMSALVRQGLHDCYLLDENGNKIYSRWQIAERVNPRDAVNSILRWTQGSQSLKDMVSKLSQKQKKNPWLSQLITRLSDTSGKETDFQSQFYGVMSKHFQSYSIIVLEDGKYHNVPVNNHPALSEAMKTITAQFKMGELPLFGDNGKINAQVLGNDNTVGEDNDFNFHKALVELQTIRAAIDHGNPLEEKDIETASANIMGICRNFGYNVTEDMVSEILDADNLRYMTEKLGFLVKDLDKALKDQKNGDLKVYDPFKFKGKYAIDTTLKNFLTPITEVLEDTAINAFYDSGKMYQSYVIPSYWSMLMNKFNLNGHQFEDFIRENYASSEWFRDKKAGIDLQKGWRNEWLRRLVTDENARKIFSHKVELNFNKHNYMRNMTDAEYTVSMIAEYFAENTNIAEDQAPSWYRVPMQSNKPSSEYIRFYSYRGDKYKDSIVYGLTKMFLQELSRIQTVNMRNLSKEDPEFIKNFDTNGRKFCLLPVFNNYLEDSRIAEEGRTVLKNEDGSISSDNNLFARLLQKKIKGEVSLTEDEDTKFSILTDKIIRNSVENRVQRILSEWEENGIIEAAKAIKGIYPTELDDEAATRWTKEQIENFLWNDTFASKNILQLTITDIAFYKDTEDLQKRLAQLHAPGIRANVEATDYEGNRVSDGKYRTFIIRDYDDFISNIIDNLNVVFDRKIAAAQGKAKEVLIDLKDSLTRPRTYNEDGTVKDKGGRYWNINVTDAQGYSSPTSYRKKAFEFGKWSRQAERIYQKLLKGTYTYTDLETAFQPLKPFVYAKLHKNLGVDKAPITSMPIPFQAKNAEYLLIMADAILQGEKELAKPNLLRAIYRIMEDSAYDGRERDSKGNIVKEGIYNGKGIDTVQFESAIKSSLQGAIDIHQFLDMQEGEEAAYTFMKNQIYKEKYRESQLEAGKKERIYDEYNTDVFVHETSFDHYCLQQEVPEHFKEHSQAHGSQIRMTTPSDLDFYTTDENGKQVTNYYTWKEPDGTVRKVTAEEFRKEYEETIAANIRESIDVLKAELHLNINPNSSYEDIRKEQNIALAKILQKEILASPRYGVDLLQACSIDKKTGEFRIPKGDPVQAKRIEQLINSIIKNRINKQEIAGGPIVQVSNFGTSKQLHIRFNDKNGNLIPLEEEYKASEHGGLSYKEYLKKNQGGIAYFEVYIPIWANDIFKKFANPDGTINIEAIEAIDPELLKMISYRIPTEEKYSCAPMKAVGFMPKEAGDAIMFPFELTEIDDSDFDVDKRYVMRKDIPILEKDPSEFLDDLVERGNDLYKNIMGQEAADGYVRRMVESILKNPMKFPTNSPFRKALFSEYQKVAYYTKAPVSGRKYRDNKIVDMTFAVLTNEMTADKILNPGGFDGPKKMGYLITAYKNPAVRAKGYSWEDLQKMSTDDLKKLSYTDKDLTYADTQVQFYKQNSAAASLIGVFAVNKIAHATLESNDIWLDVAELCGEDAFNIAGHYEIDEKTGEKKIVGGMTFKDRMQIDVRYDIAGNLIGKTLGSLVSASADAGKDPILNLMNINMTTAGMLNTMLRLGMTFEDASLFLSQDIIERLLNQFNRENLTNYVSLSELIDKWIFKYKENNKIVDSSKINTEALTKEELIEGITPEEHGEIDYKVLLTFKKLQLLTDAMRKPTFATRFNSISSAVGPLILDNLIQESKRDSFLSENGDTHFYTADGRELDINDIFSNHPILEQFARTLDLAKTLFLDMPSGCTGFRELLKNVPDDIKNKMYNDKKLFDKFANFYQSYLLIQSGVINQDRLKYYVNEFAKEFNSKKYDKKYPDNELLKEIKLQISKSGKPYLSIKITGMDEQRKEELRSAWIDLHKVDPELSKKLFDYSFFIAGIGFSPKTFMALVPTYVKERLKGENGASYIDTYRKFPTVMNDVVIDQFICNNWGNNKLVPIKKSEDYHFIIDTNSNTLKVSRENEKEELKNVSYMKLKVADNMYLYKQIGKNDNEDLIYERMQPLGNNGEYLEMYTSKINSPLTVVTKTTEEKENEPSDLKTSSPQETDAASPSTEIVISKSEQKKNTSELIDAFMLQNPAFTETSAKEKIEEIKKRGVRKYLKFLQNVFEKKGLHLNLEEVEKEFEKYC